MLKILKKAFVSGELKELLAETDLEALTTKLVAKPELEYAKVAERRQIALLLNQPKDNPFLTDPNLWLSLAESAAKHGIFAAPKAKIPAEQIYHLLRPFLSNFQDQPATNNMASAILHPQLSVDEFRTIIEHCIKQKKAHQSTPSYTWHNIISRVSDKALLREYFDSPVPDVGSAALRRFGHLLGNQPWQELYSLARENPLSVMKINPRHVDVELWRIFWESGVPDCKKFAIDAATSYLSKSSKRSPALGKAHRRDRSAYPGVVGPRKSRVRRVRTRFGSGGTEYACRLVIKRSC